MALLLIAESNETEHMVDNLFGYRDVPHRERAFAAVADSGREHRIALDCEFDGLVFRRRVLEERDREWGLHDDLPGDRRGAGAGGIWREVWSGGGGFLEEKESAEHVFVGFVVAGAEYKLGVRVVV